MKYILNIDTSLETASICLAVDGKVIQYAESNNQKEHSLWLHSSIQKILIEEKINASDLSAISVCIGPGSYTGLRVSLSAAKGLCYALQKPLIGISSLLLTATAQVVADEAFIRPCIDARRMEVYTCLYDSKFNEIERPSAQVIEQNSFEEILSRKKIIFCGNGAEKIKALINNQNAIFSSTFSSAKDMANLSFKKYNNEDFQNLVEAEPLYIKSFNANLQ